MKKKESTLWNMLWSLTLITAIAGGLLGYTYQLTEEPIARASKAASRNKQILDKGKRQFKLLTKKNETNH